MAVHCPYCRQEIALRDPKPGRFTTSCRNCRFKYLLAVPDDPSLPVTVAGLKAERVAYESRQAAINASTMHTPPNGPRAESADAPRNENKPPASITAPTSPPEETIDVPSRLGRAVPASERPSTMARVVSPSEKLSTMARPLDSGAETRDIGERPDVAVGARLPSDMPSSLGGYQILQELGRGGMGAVYLAKQVSLGRNVALKVMKPEWASNPTFLARFSREAYAAAQLTHHNVVQIYDFGEAKGTSYFSMEFVEGRTLSQLLREKAKLDPEAAVGYVLQAARGLKYAHDQCMIHRDIKPENLLLDQHGIIKVADLGLVKSPKLAEVLDRADSGTTTDEKEESAEDPCLTRADVAMGTPAYMAPEQGRDAGRVDARADIYSLGCTLYVLVTGRPPFEGRTALEIITKHQTEPVPPPEVVAKRVPKALSEIILRMVAKRPEDRFQDLAEVIQALESYLGIVSVGPFTPREEDTEQLERAVMEFRNAPLAKLKPRVIAGFLGLCGLMIILNLVKGWPILAGGFLGLGLLTVLAYFIVDGLTRKSIVFTRVRELVFGSRPIDWLTALAGIALLVTILVVSKLLWVWLAFCAAAILLAFSLRSAIDRPLEVQRASAISSAEALLKRLRLQGIEEDSIRQFVCKYSGDRWEEFYEALFGFEAKLAARERWGKGDRGRSRPRWGLWREPIVSWIDAKQRARREARDRALLQKLEEQSLCAQGENLVVARRKARRTADAMVAMAAESKATLPGQEPAVAIAKAIRDAARQPERLLVEHEKGHLYGPRNDGVLDLILGPRVRFLLGSLLLAGFFAWMNQNGLLSRRHVEQVAQEAREAVRTRDLEVVQEASQRAARELQGRVARATETEPLRVPVVPKKVRGVFNGFGPGVGGLILLISSFFRGSRMSLFVIPAAVVALLGPGLGIPSTGPLPPQAASLAIAGGLAVLGIVLGRSRR